MHSIVEAAGTESVPDSMSAGREETRHGVNGLVRSIMNYPMYLNALIARDLGS